ncbi:hypothetical protein QAD02_003549 [Eretmocerus hayati]|uniref:Uncharacterized protein n=1 Tax=Eretmocerus hayati TaxID=131215 RepID=A0ACC2NM78_9HYME|nr:hypothetical protein QAD02_003549 [Eretmocerus hayati]
MLEGGKEEERSPDSKVENTVAKEEFVGEPGKNSEENSWEVVDNNNFEQLSDTQYIGEGIETLLPHITKMQEDMKGLKKGMLSRMGELTGGMRAENDGKAGEVDARISILEAKDKGKDLKY